MKELPILFSTSMVQAIIEGRKTMTRRIIKTTHHGWDCQKMIFALSKIIKAHFTKISSLIGFHAFFTGDGFEDHKLGVKCPYGQPGDMLWVRETFCPMVISDYDGNGNDHHTYLYKTEPGCSEILSQMEDATWKPSIHMPKSAARIWLQVEEIRVERLQDISWNDSIAEGIHVKYWGEDTLQPYAYRKSKPEQNATDYKRSPIEAFRDLWESINGNDWNFGWNANPWVWVVKFKVLSSTGKPSF